jgi:hypothetical protein
MADEVQETPFGGILRVIKLTTGEEIVGLVSEASSEKIFIKMPALIESYMMRDALGEMIEYCKLTNYLSNIRSSEVSIFRHVIVYIGSATVELEKMYAIYHNAMETDPKSLITSAPENTEFGPEAGLHLLTDLFNNEDFVNFVNDLIDTYEGAEIMIDVDDDGEEIEESDKQEPSVEDLLIEEAPKQPKPIKRSKGKPGPNKLSYDPNLPSDNPESWSDNPNDYI